MKKILIVAAMVSLLVASGCATSRVWQTINTKEPSSKEEVSTAVVQCESTEIVAKAHKTVHTWRTIQWAIIWAYPLNIIPPFIVKGAQTDYVGTLANCMRESDFNYFEYTEGINWDAHSGSDMSKSEWLEKQKPKPKERVVEQKEIKRRPAGTDTGWGRKDKIN